MSWGKLYHRGIARTSDGSIQVVSGLLYKRKLVEKLLISRGFILSSNFLKKESNPRNCYFFISPKPRKQIMFFNFSSFLRRRLINYRKCASDDYLLEKLMAFRIIWKWIFSPNWNGMKPFYYHTIPEKNPEQSVKKIFDDFLESQLQLFFQMKSQINFISQSI